MIVSFSVGDKSKRVINTLKKTADNVDFYSSNSIQELIKEAKLRHISFKRIIFSTTILKNVEKDLKELNDFIKNFSSSTEVVMIIMGSDTGSDKIFNSIFNSPMYTPVILPKATSKNLLELVLSDILEIKTRYYVLDVKDSKKEETKNQLKTEEENNSNSNSSEGTSNDGVPMVNLSRDFSNGPSSVFTGFGGEVVVNATAPENNTLDTPPLNFDGSSTEGNENLSTTDSEDDDSDLSIGDFGSQHSDTGYLDEDDADYQEFVKSVENEERVPDRSRVEIVTPQPRVIEVRKPELGKRNSVSPKPVKKVEKRNIDLVISVRGNGSTQAIIDESVKIVNEDGAKVLIIDLDNEENGILSFIDTDKFYREGNNNGISKQRVYEEDGVYIMSNGYGSPVTNRDVQRLINSRVLNQFDMIYIDCPTKSLSVLSKDIIDVCNILIISKGDLSQLVATSLALTDRSVVSLDVERSIMNDCVVEIDGDCNKEDVDYINSTFVFANGNWLNRLD